MLEIEPRRTDQSISFVFGGYYFLKSMDLSLCLSLVGTTGSRISGHRHLDMGSFTLSYRGVPIIVDPGTFTYTRNKRERDAFRSLESHNLAVTAESNLNEPKLGGYFKLAVEDKMTIERNTGTGIRFHHRYFPGTLTREIVIDENTCTVQDDYDGEIESLIHLHPSVSVDRISGKEFLLSREECSVCVTATGELTIQEYDYSGGYGRVAVSKVLRLAGVDQVNCRLECARGEVGQA